MANYANLLATIAANIYTNNNNEVTAAMVKTAVDQMVATLGVGYQFMGVATPATTPGSTDVKQFYIASTPGTYTDFLDAASNPLEVNDGEVAVLKYDTAWNKEITGAATSSDLVDIVGVDDTVALVWESGGINYNTGADYASASYKRTQFIDIASINYIDNFRYPYYYYIYQYRDDMSFISILPVAGNISVFFRDNVLFGTDVILDPACKYVRLMCSVTPTYQTPTLTAGLYIEGTIDRKIDEAVAVFAKKDGDVLIVDANGNGDYTTIEDALANAKDTATRRVTIFVRPGTYYPAPVIYADTEPYVQRNRNLSIIGEYRDSCILRGSVGYYGDYADYALLRLTGNVLIQNLTLISTCEDYDATIAEKGWVSTPDEDVTKRAKAYCIHIEGTRRAGSVVTIDNCKMYNDHFSCVGWGLWTDSTVRVVNCDCISDVDAATSEKSEFNLGYGTIWGHCHARNEDPAPNQRLEVLSCRLRNTNYNRAVFQLFTGTEKEGTDSTLLFANNIFKTADTPNSVYIEQVAGYPDINKLDDLCFGNNVATINVTQ